MKMSLDTCSLCYLYIRWHVNLICNSCSKPHSNDHVKSYAIKLITIIILQAFGKVEVVVLSELSFSPFSVTTVHMLK